MLERLQKILSARGIASRRKAEEYIERGLVLVNSVPAKVGDKADPEKDTIEVKGEVLEARQKMLYFLLYKPVGVITSNVDREAEDLPQPGTPMRGFEVTHSALERFKDKDGGRRPETTGTIVRDLLPPDLQGQVFPVGRLDKDSEGLLLLTNDGVLAFRLTHPKFDHAKEYEVETDVPMTQGMLRKFEEGVLMDGTKTKPAEVHSLADNRFRITLTEGRNRQIRRMCRKVGAAVTSLRRIRIASLTDDVLKPGEIRPLTMTERDALMKSVGLEQAS